MSYFELKDYIRELEYSTTCTFGIKAPNSGILVDVDNDKDILDMTCSLEDGDEVEVFVRHLVDEAILGPMLIENGSHVDMGESGSAFNTRPNESENFNFGVGEDHLNSEDPVATFSTSPPFTTTPPFNTATADGTTTDGATDDDIDVSPAGLDFLEEEVEGSDYSTEDSVESEAKLVGDDDEEEYGEAEPNLGFDETGTGKVSDEGRLGGDEPYFASSDEDSFELDENECCNDDEHESSRSRRVKLSRKRSSKTQKIIHDPTTKKVVWQLGMVFKDVKELRQAVIKYAVRRRVQVEKWVNEPKKVRVRCKDGCPWLLYGCLDKTTNNFMIKTYNPKHTCNKITRNCLCNAKFLSEAFRERIIEQPNIRIFKLQEMIRKKLKLHVGKTTVRRAIAKVLKDIMGDHVVKFGRILDYKDKLLRTNPGTSCVVKENISRSMDCTIEFNGAAGFEVKEGLCQHKMDIARRTCSYRVWQLRGIPCAHVVTALYFKKFSLYDYIDNCYSKETYLRIYANVIEPLTNIEMWPISTNPTIEPSEITNMPGRPPKARRKEVGETKKSGKLPRTGLAMTCSIFHVRGHNKRGCPQREGVESSTRQSAPSPTASVRAEPIGSGRGRSKPKKTPSAPSEGEPPLKRGRGRQKKTSLVAPSAPPLPTDFLAFSSALPTYHASSSITGTTKRGRGRAGETHLQRKDKESWEWVCSKRQMTSNKIYSIGQAKVTRSSDVTGDIGYTPNNTTKLEWNGKAAISTRKLHEIREKQRKKSM
ncbi:hypothetical protein MTR67_033933 [Solanum verrucosum]|uniref:SWIM-type domain-containing protein n=1 Tax=Solanum verrucosum TaxID=315347 RepID=A0AAF0ZJS1_SOLVR|nr:hypothetical protein MTR67_033933 [Solanum verrucosum]